MKADLEQKKRQLNLLHAVNGVDIFAFISINEYLEEVYKKLKTESHSYSYKKFSEDLGFSHSNIIWLYINGKRKMSMKSGKVICKALKLKGGARRYAEQLIRLESITIHQTREKIFGDLFKLKQEFGSDSKGKRKLEYYSHWYFPLVREYIAINPKVRSAEEIANNFLFDVFPKQVEESLRVLEDLGLIKHDKLDHCYKVTQQQVGLDHKTGVIAANRYHQKVCELSSEAAIKIEESLRELNTLTLSLKEEDIPKVKAYILNLCRETFNLDNPQEAERVFQLNVQFFPVTNKINKSEKENEE